MQITSADIKEVVLREDDFGHEMRVGNIFSSVKYPAIQYDQICVWPPDHGGTYKDQATGKARQFDYRCRVTKGKNREQNILIAAECKNLNPDFPLVVCGRQRTNGEDYHLFVKQDIAGNVQVKRVDGYSSFYKPDGFVGKSILRLKRKPLMFGR